MKNQIRAILSEALPTVDFDSDFLFVELDSLSVATVLMLLSNEYSVSLGAEDVTPRNFRSLDSLVAMVENKLENK